MSDIFDVFLSPKAVKNLKKVPVNISIKLYSWVDSVSQSGLMATRKISGYHDEPLRGKRKGQRSIRLNKAYRAFYIINSNDEIEFVDVLEVNKHEY